MRIWLITVNFKKTAPTIELVNSLEKTKLNFDLKIFIADNEYSLKSKKELIELKENSNLDIDLVFFNENKYYWPAANHILLQNYKIYNHYPDWVIICNNDIVFNDINFFDKLSKFDGKMYNVIGPNIFNSSKKQLNPFMKNSINYKTKLFWDLYFKSFYLSLLLGFLIKCKNFFNKDIKNNKIMNVYAVHGSAIVFSKHFFMKGGIIDSKFRLFCEELSTAEISKKIGCSIYFLPSLQLTHRQHSSTKNHNKKQLFMIAKESHQYFIKEYFKK